MRLLAAILVGWFVMPAFAEPPTSFSSAKEVAIKLWWDIGPSSFYCGCPYRYATEEEKAIREGKIWAIGFACGYQAKQPVTKNGKPNIRALRIEWEHLVPADWIATGFGCKDKKRADCRKIEGYNEAEGDLFNIVPAVGELNADRSNKLYGVIPKERRKYGACDFEVSDSTAEPMESIRGDIARVWLYMIHKYGLKLSPDYVKLIENWSEDDPVDNAEKRRHDAIAEKMGWSNSYVVDQ